MKAILVINNPKTCSQCPCYSFNAQAKRFECDAKLFLKGKIGVVELNKKPHWCPLKPMPSEKLIENRWYSEDYSFGWNDCISEIEGEKNEDL